MIRPSVLFLAWHLEGHHDEQASLVEAEQLAQLHLHQLHQLLVLHRIDLVQEAHHAGQKGRWSRQEAV